MSGNASPPESRVLIVAPIGADAHNVCAILERTNVPAAACPNLSALAIELDHGCGAILLTEEALDYSRHEDLSRALDRQPKWSDIPIILIVSRSQQPAVGEEAARIIRPRGNLILVERPLNVETLLSTVRSALRARQRQYEVRDLLAERDELLASMERRVAERTAKLQELNAEMEAFSYSVSHDLRAPLRSVESFARILREEFGAVLPEEGRRYAERIVKNAEKMDRLMQDVLAFSRISRSEIRLEPLDLDVVLADVLDQYPDLSAAHRQISIEKPLGVALAHAPSLFQCFSNLLQNALKFVPPDRTPQIRVFTELGDERMRVNVCDNGMGIDPAHQIRIFGMFERASPPTVPGTGVGLAIVKKAVERMDGAVGVRSLPNQGSCFWLELKRAT